MIRAVIREPWNRVALSELLIRYFELEHGPARRNELIEKFICEGQTVFLDFLPNLKLRLTGRCYLQSIEVTVFKYHEVVENALVHRRLLGLPEIAPANLQG